MQSISTRIFPRSWFARAETAEPGFSALLPERKVEKAPDGLARLSASERVRRAFKDVPLNAREAMALQALLGGPGATAVELSRICRWMDTGWRLQMLLLCQRRRRYFWPDGLEGDVTNGAVMEAITDYDSDALSFRARPELAVILREAVDAAPGVVPTSV